MNPNIAMGVNNVQLNNPLDAYAKMAQIQAAKNQNAMLQHQLLSSKREDDAQNIRNQAFQSATDEAGNVNYNMVASLLAKNGRGSDVPKIIEMAQKADSEKTKSQAEKVKLVTDELELSRKQLDSISTPQEFWQHQLADLSNPVLGSFLTSRISGMKKPDGTPLSVQEYMEAKRQKIMQASPEEFAQLLGQAKLGYKQYVEMNKPVTYQRSSGDETWLDQVAPGGPAVEVPGSRQKMKMTPAQAATHSLARQREARAVANTNNKADPETNSQTSIIVTDKYGNRKLDSTKAKALINSQKGVSNAENILSQIDDITERVLPKTSSSGLGRAVTEKLSYLAGSDTPFVGQTKEANDKMKSFANAALGALNSPLMKGAPSNADATRALSVINDEDTSIANKQQAMLDLRNAIEAAIDFHNEAISVYDDESIKALKGVGVQTIVKPTGKKSKSSEQPSGGGKPTVENW